MSFKKLGLISMLAAGLSLSCAAQAGSLTIKNGTNFDSTAIINGGKCSASALPGGKGITKAHSQNTIESGLILFACASTPSPKLCKADVYMTNNCNSSGAPIIATAYFDTKTGLKSVTTFNSSYTINGTGFEITIDGGPSKLSTLLGLK